MLAQKHTFYRDTRRATWAPICVSTRRIAVRPRNSGCSSDTSRYRTSSGLVLHMSGNGVNQAVADGAVLNRLQDYRVCASIRCAARMARMRSASAGVTAGRVLLEPLPAVEGIAAASPEFS